ncbi:cytochrome P450 [Sesbania bispinosa]|nr:cytochrome P450 [Sesbania bispinosa]
MRGKPIFCCIPYVGGTSQVIHFNFDSESVTLATPPLLSPSHTPILPLAAVIQPSTFFSCRHRSAIPAVVQPVTAIIQPLPSSFNSSLVFATTRHNLSIF